jgi:hypothetical protein
MGKGEGFFMVGELEVENQKNGTLKLILFYK